MAKEERTWHHLAVYIELSNAADSGPIRVRFTDCTTPEEPEAQLQAQNAQRGYDVDSLGFVYREGTPATNVLRALLALDPLDLTISEKGGGPYPDSPHSVLAELEELLSSVYNEGFSYARKILGDDDEAYEGFEVMKD